MFWLCQCSLPISYVWHGLSHDLRLIVMGNIQHIQHTSYSPHNNTFKRPLLRISMKISWFRNTIFIVVGVCWTKVVPNTAYASWLSTCVQDHYSTLATRFINDDGARLNCPLLVYYSTAISHHCISVAVSVSMAASYVLCPACNMMDDGLVIGSHISPDIILPWSRHCTFISIKGQSLVPMYHLPIRVIWHV